MSPLLRPGDWTELCICYTQAKVILVKYSFLLMTSAHYFFTLQLHKWQNCTKLSAVWWILLQWRNLSPGPRHQPTFLSVSHCLMGERKKNNTKYGKRDKYLLFFAILLLQSRAGVRPLTFFKWDLEVESLKKAKAWLSLPCSSVQKSCGHTHTHTKKSLTGCCMERVFERQHTGWFSYTSYNHVQHCVISDEGIGIPFLKGSLSFLVDCPAVQLKFMVITHRFHGIESISIIIKIIICWKERRFFKT